MSGAELGDPRKVYFLRQVRWLRRLSFEELAMLAAHLKEEQHPAGAAIVRQGEEGHRFYVVRSGYGRVVLATEDGERILGRIGPGDNFGEAALLSGEPRGASVVADTDCVVLAMERDDFHLVVGRSPAFAQALLTTLGAWVCRQGLGDERPATSPVAVVRVVGGDAASRAALAFHLVRGIRREVGAPDIGLLWADAEPPPPWFDVPISMGRAADVLAEYAESCERVVVVGGAEESWGGETDHRVQIGGEWRDRASGGQRGVVVREGRPADAPDWARVVWLDGLGPLVEAARRGVELTGGDTGRALERLARVVTGRRVGVALGGGGAWGLANVGVLRALGRLAIPVDLVAGTSAGALVGAAWCADGEAGLGRLLEGFRFGPRRLAQLARGAVGGLLSSAEAERLIASFVPAREFRELGTPFYAVAYSVVAGERRVLERGSLVKAVTASNAMPFFVAPVAVGGDRLIDGGFSDNVPAEVVYSRGADFIVGVDVVPQRVVAAEGGIGGIHVPVLDRLDVSMAALYGLLHQAARGYTYVADVIVEPDLGRFHWYHYDHASEIADLAEAQVLARGEAILNTWRSFNRSVI